MIHRNHYYLSVFIGVVLWVLLPQDGFSQIVELQKFPVDYVTRVGDIITIKWPAGEQNDSLTISVGKGEGNVCCKLTDRFTAVAQDTTFSIKGHQSCKITLERLSTDSTTLNFTIQKKGLKGAITFVKHPIIPPDNLDFGIITFKQRDNKIDLGVKEGKASLIVLNPSQETLRIMVPAWLTVSPQFVSPNSKGSLSFEVDILEVIDTLNKNTGLFSGNLHHIQAENTTFDNTSNVLNFKKAQVGLQRDSAFWPIVGLLLVSCLIGGALIFLFLKKQKEKSFSNIVQYMGTEFNITLDATEEGILKGLTQILHTSANVRADKDIEAILSSYQSKINSLPTGEIGEIRPLDVIGTGENTRKASDIINGLISLFNERIKFHQQQWHLLGTCLGLRTEGAFSVEVIEKLVEDVKKLKDEEKGRLKQIRNIAESTDISWEGAIIKIESNLSSLQAIMRQVENDFRLSGDDPDALKQNLRTWKDENDRDWNKLFETFNIKGDNAVLISHLAGIKRHIDEICEVCGQEDLIFVKGYITTEKNKNAQTLNTLATSLGIQNATPQSINESIVKLHELFNNIIKSLTLKAIANAPGATFSITKDNVIDRINSLRDPNFGKPVGFPDFVKEFKDDIKRVEEELKSIIETMRKTNDMFFTNLLGRAYYQEGRQKGVKPALEILSNDSMLQNQLGIKPDDMRYLSESSFYYKFIREYMDIYTNDLAKIYAYSNVDYTGINMTHILYEQHLIDCSSIQSIYRHLSSAYEKIGITLLTPKLFEDRFDAALHENSPSASSFQGIYNGKYGNIFEAVKSSIIYDIDEIGMKSEMLAFYKKPKVFKK